MGNKICAVVVTYNRKELLCECIAALLEQSMGVDILVIDNASTDGTRESLEGWILGNNIKYYNTGANLGGAGGFHYGMKKAMRGSYDYLWLMDDDTIAQKDAVRCLYDAACRLQDRFGFLCSMVYFNEDELCKMNCPGVPLKEYDLEKYRYVREGMICVKNASFVALFVRTKVVRRVGLPLKEFFIWFDDYEYTSRIGKIYDNYLVCDSKVHHKMKENRTTDIVTEKPERVSRYYYDYRNRFYVAKRDGAEELAKYFLSVCRVLYRILAARTDHKIRKCATVLRGVLAGAVFHPRVEYVGKSAGKAGNHKS